MTKSKQENETGAEIECPVCGVEVLYLVLSRSKAFDHEANEWIDEFYVCQNCRNNEDRDYEEGWSGGAYHLDASIDWIKDWLKTKR